jgi:MerR family transcriptional regulator, light-induced transcriptional regulator
MESTRPPALTISAVERETGLSKDVLRKWESRYGFPMPLRDSFGERAYPAEQVSRLRLIKRLMDTGMRPSRVIAESEENLRVLARRSERQPPVRDDVESVTLEMLRSEDPSGLRQRLYREVLRQGMEVFVMDTLTRLNYAVGEAWVRGELDIHEEHLYTEAVQWLLRNAIADLSTAHGSPRVLLTTLPEERHGLGILMVAALLSLRGAYCISLGTQTPSRDIAQAAKAHDVDVVALSFSSFYPRRRILPALSELRRLVDSGMEIWAGGAGSSGLDPPPTDTRLLPDLRQVMQTLESWQAARTIARG